MLKVDSLEHWRNVAGGFAMTYHGASARTETVRMRTSGPVNVFYTPVTEDGEVLDDAIEYIGTLSGDDGVRVTSPGGFRLNFEAGKGVLMTVYDDRQSFEAPSPETPVFTVFEKRGLESQNPLDIIAHRENVVRRLEFMASEPERREQEMRRKKLDDQMVRLEERLARLDEWEKAQNEAQNGDVDTSGDAAAE